MMTSRCCHTSRRRVLIALGGLLAGGALAGCGAGDPTAPPSIRYGEDVCAHCGMIISEEGHAAAYRTSDGRVRLFDSVGEMVRYHRQHHEPVTGFFVHDVETHAWLAAPSAYYVLSPALRTPMAGGVVALQSEAAAQRLAERYISQPLTWPELLERATLPETIQRHH
jgi:copper chaperone NosL